MPPAAVEAWNMGLFDGIVGSVIGGVGGLLGNSSASSEASKNRAWQEYMSSTAHQREVKDLRKAGLNPILSAFGSGASSAAGATAGQMNPFAGVPEAINSARKIDEVDKEALKLKEQEVQNETEKTKATVSLQDEMKNTEVSKQSELATQQILNAEQAGLTRMNSTNAILERDNIIKRGDEIQSSTHRNMSQADLNSATATRTAVDKALSEREVRAGRYEEKTQQYTRPVRDVIDTLTAPIRGIFHGKIPTGR